MDFILYMLSGIFVYIYYFCCWHKFANKKINFKDYKIYLSLIVFIGVGAVTNYLFGATIKMLVITVTVMFLSYIVVFHDFRKSLISTIVAQITMMICEALFSIFFGILSIDVNYF